MEQPFYKGDGNHSIAELQKLCNDFKEFCYLRQLKIQELEAELHQQRFNNKHNLSIDQKISDEILNARANKNHKMKSLVDWLHNSIKGDSLDIVKITDLNKTVLGLKDQKSDEVFIVGNMHDLTFILEGNDV